MDDKAGNRSPKLNVNVPRFRRTLASISNLSTSDPLPRPTNQNTHILRTVLRISDHKYHQNNGRAVPTQQIVPRQLQPAMSAAAKRPVQGATQLVVLVRTPPPGTRAAVRNFPLRRSPRPSRGSSASPLHLVPSPHRRQFPPTNQGCPLALGQVQ